MQRPLPYAAVRCGALRAVAYQAGRRRASLRFFQRVPVTEFLFGLEWIDLPLEEQPMAPRILVVEDEPDIVEVLQYNLEREGFTVDVSNRGDEALEAIRRLSPDLVVLDLMLPGMDGLEVLRTLRQDRATRSLPVLLLTARGEEIDRVVGLELGADDYVTKPFSPREVTLRIKAILRRGEADEEGSERLECGEVVLDLGGHRALVAGQPVSLTATEFRLLKILMERRHRVQTRDQLLDAAWGYSGDVDSRTVDTHVRRLRRKLGAAADQIETIVGVGYRFGS